MRISIRIKSTVFLGTLLLLTVSILSISVLNGIKNNQQQQQETFLNQQIDMSSLFIYQSYATGSFNEMDTFIKSRGQLLANQISKLSGMPVELYNMNGESVGISSAMGKDSDISEILHYGLNNKTAYQISGDWLDYIGPVNLSTGQIAVVHFRYSLRKSIEFYKDIKKYFIYIGSFIFFISFIVAYIFFYNITGGIVKLKKAVDSIKEEDYNFNPFIKRRDELGELSEGISFMSSRIKGDISMLKEERNKLTLAVSKLRNLEQAQKQFIGNITHEFKTPLTVIRAYVDLMEMYPEDRAMVKKAKQNVGNETDRLYEMVEKALQLSELEKYEFEAKKEYLDLGDILEKVCNRMETKAKKFEIEINRKIIPVKVYADEDDINQIFINLIDNAIKYNKIGGQILVRNYTDENYIYVEIIDTGIGIPMEAKEKVFQPFYRVNKELSRQTGGTGLGLSLVKSIIEKQQGNIIIKETSNNGTTFLVKFLNEKRN
jgi:signal transduction histidine kinase